MSARIAPEPISAAVATSSDHRARQNPAEQPVVQPANSGAETAFSAAENAPAVAGDEPSIGERLAEEILPPLPKPPAPPGTTFAAAVISGALSPRPQTPEEVLLRLGSAWSPPDSDLRLADRSA